MKFNLKSLLLLSVIFLTMSASRCQRIPDIKPEVYVGNPDADEYVCEFVGQTFPRGSIDRGQENKRIWCDEEAFHQQFCFSDVELNRIFEPYFWCDQWNPNRPFSLIEPGEVDPETKELADEIRQGDK